VQRRDFRRAETDRRQDFVGGLLHDDTVTKRREQIVGQIRGVNEALTMALTSPSWARKPSSPLPSP